nr:hypothetical protein CFP56_59694 [Quercus suber]
MSRLKREQEMGRAYPEDQLHVSAVPAVADMVREETPGVAVVLLGEEDADPSAVRAIAEVEPFRGPVPPDDGEEERSGARHDGDVGHDPAAVVVLQLLDDPHEEGMLGHGAHDIVADAGGDGAAEEGRVGEQGLERAVAAVVHVDVDAPVVGEDEVADGVGALDGILVALEGLEEPRVLLRDEVCGALVRPQLVLPLGLLMQHSAAMLRDLPGIRNARVLVGLMDDARDQMGSGVDQIGAGGWELGFGDGISGAVDEEQGEQGPDGVDEETDNGEVEKEEEEDAAAHGRRRGVVRSRGDLSMPGVGGRWSSRAPPRRVARNRVQLSHELWGVAEEGQVRV